MCKFTTLRRALIFFWSGRNVFEAEWTGLFRELSYQLLQEWLHLQNIWNRQKNVRGESGSPKIKKLLRATTLKLMYSTGG